MQNRVWLLFVMGTFFGIGFQPSQGNERNLSFLAELCFRTTPLARCPLAMVQRNGLNLSTSDVARAPHELHTLLHTYYLLMINGPGCAAMCRHQISKKVGLVFSINCMIVIQGWCMFQLWESAKMRDKWTHQCSSGNQCSFRGCELGE